MANIISSKPSIVTVPAPVLRQVAEEIAFDKPEAREIVKALWYALVHSPIEGVGIAAEQIGATKRIFVLRKGKEGYQEYINPEILWVSEEQGPGKDRKGGVFLEGCLSIPGIYGPVIRPLMIEVRYSTLKGKRITEKMKEPYSRYFQHELDHLNGILFIDHVMQQRGKLYEVNEKDELVEIKMPEIG